MRLFERREARFPDAEGKPVLLDDVVEFKGREWLVIAVTHKGKLALRREGERNRWIESGLVRRKR